MNITRLIFDTDHAHQDSLVLGRKSKYITWNRVDDGSSDIAYYTNRQVMLNTKHKYKIAILTEPRVMIPDAYDYIEQNDSKFSQIFTHDSALLKMQNSLWIPGNGVWYKGDFTHKTHNISMLCSSKTMTPMHIYRRSIANFVSQNNLADVMGEIYGTRIPLELAYDTHRYNIAIENYIDDTYFTEKLLNCFASMTVPIYVGSSIKFLSKFFDINGIIHIDKNNLTNLPQYLSQCSEDDYQRRKNAIISNYNMVQRFLSIEDYIWEEYILGVDRDSD